MLSRVIITKFGRGREPLQNLHLRFLELARTLGHALLEQLILLPNRGVQRTRLEQVPDPQDHFGRVEWLGEKILDATSQDAPLCLIARIGGEHEHREIASSAKLRPNRLEHTESIELWHVQVEENPIRVPTLP